MLAMLSPSHMLAPKVMQNILSCLFNLVWQEDLGCLTDLRLAGALRPLVKLLQYDNPTIQFYAVTILYHCSHRCKENQVAICKAGGVGAVASLFEASREEGDMECLYELPLIPEESTQDVAALVLISLTGVASHKEQALAVLQKRPNVLDRLVRSGKDLAMELLEQKPELFNTRSKVSWIQHHMMQLMDEKNVDPHWIEDMPHLQVRRDDLLHDTLCKGLLLEVNPELLAMHGAQVEYKGEAGVDEGGLRKEWLQAAVQQLVRQEHGLFASCAGAEGLYLSPHALVANSEALPFLEMLGRLLGMALCGGDSIGVRLALPVFKLLLDKPVEAADLQAVDPMLHHNLEKLLAMEVTEDTGLWFATELHAFGEVQAHNLIPNGASRAVTQENKGTFVELMAKHMLVHSVSELVDAVKEGFHAVVPTAVSAILTAQDLQRILAGQPEISIADWKQHTVYEGDLNDHDPLVVWFWNELEAMSQSQRSQVLEFATASPQTPLGGFSQLRSGTNLQQFTLRSMPGDDTVLPQAHTCFNTLDVPPYSSQEVLGERLRTLLRLHQLYGTGFFLM